MVNMSCTCQTTCADPNRLNGCFYNCVGGETCICPDGFFLIGTDCVPREDCGCYVQDEEVIVQEGDDQLFLACTKQCSCNTGVLSCNDYRCDDNAVCDNRSESFQCFCKDGYHGDGISCTRLTDCDDVFDAGLIDDGVYSILPMNWPGIPFQVYCKDGWTVSIKVFQRREDGSVEFNRGWADYKEGFGDPIGEIWLGLEKLYYLTNQEHYKLKISLISDGITYEMNYSWFKIDSEGNNYALKELGSYSGNIGSTFFAHVGFDPMAVSHTFQFSTPDQDNDNHPTVDCAGNFHGGWWYKQCYKIYLNGPYGSPNAPGICYLKNTIAYCNIPFTEMSIKL
ncbi:Fibrinogen C domain-containing protein 1 [Holothuria leucospilota]|uniref:Fibrinogen C domain-containing protein 1 n=1 Tax=Holothuria leucospilota TaxID=206669 RepID=A0A9Q1H5P7_HOLLE|nr:Fibrinogen C domain-containing protein 1 [Holothuria leucospilota]